MSAFAGALAGGVIVAMKDVPLARFVMVLSGMAPLFALWAAHGSKAVPDKVFIPICVGAAVLPTVFLWLRISTATRKKLTAELVVARAEDHKDHLLVYLFAMLLPFYAPQGGTVRELLTLVGAVLFIGFLFWHLHMHYMNIWFAIFGYRVYTIYGPEDGGTSSYRGGRVLITKRLSLEASESIVALRISDYVYFERKADEA